MTFLAFLAGLLIGFVLARILDAVRRPHLVFTIGKPEERE